MSEEKFLTKKEIGETPAPNPNAATVSTEAEVPTGHPPVESTQEPQSENANGAVDPSSIYPQEEFVPYIEKSFDAMIKDFNHFRNNAKTEDVKALYLKAITSITKAKNEVLSAVNADVETRNK